MDFEPYVKIHSLVSVHPKSVILGQMINLNMIFYVVLLYIRLTMKSLIGREHSVNSQ